MAIPAGICFILLQQTKHELLRVEDISTRAEQSRALASQIGLTLFSFTGATLDDLSAEERRVVFRDADDSLASLQTSMLAGKRLAAEHLSEREQTQLSSSLDSISDSWSEIKERIEEGITPAEKAFHFLKLFKEGKLAGEVIRTLQAKASQTADRAVASSLKHSEQMGLFLLIAMGFGAAVCITALLNNYRSVARIGYANAHLKKAVVQLKERDRALADQNERFSLALENMSHGLCMFDRHQRLIVCNTRYSEIYDLPADLIQPGTSLTHIVDHCVRRGYFDQKASEAIISRCELLAAGGAAVSCNLEIRDGRFIQQSYQPMPNGGWVGTHEDATERREAEARIEHMARHDALTGLPNRVLFRDELDLAVARSRNGATAAILYLDLDHFKSVNDTLGHPVGDALLREVATRLIRCLKSSDTVARLGGDEFAVVQVGIEKPADTIELAQQLIEELGAPYYLEGHQVVIGTSVGIAFGPSDSTDADQLLKCADLALYRAKADGRGTYRFFEAEMDARMQSRHALELALRKALQNDQFEVFYQPLVNTKTEQITGFEALLRWQHPERGYVPPSEFIPLAEEIGLIGRIGAWVLKEACCEAVKFPESLKIAVNLSPVQFKGQALVLDVMAALGTSGLSPNRLELEVTESVMLQDTEATLEILHLLQELGVRISMDDFGTGYSSLSYLRKFPFDKIKIDQSFIREMSDQIDSMAIIRAVTKLSSDLGMATTAEGVETQDQLRKLQLEGCNEVQGYFFSKPRPASEIPTMLLEREQQTQSAA